MDKMITEAYERVKQYWIPGFGGRKRYIRRIVKELLYGVYITATNATSDPIEYTFVIGHLRSDYLQLFGAIYDAWCKAKTIH